MLTLTRSLGDRFCKDIFFILVGEAKGDISGVPNSSEFTVSVGLSLTGNPNFARTAGSLRANC